MTSVSITYLIQLSDLVENKLYPALSLESLHYNMDLFLGEHAFYKGKSVFLYETLAEKEIVSLMDEMYYCESMSAFSRLNHEMSVLIFMEEIKKFLDTKKISVRKIEIAILGDAVIIKTEN